LKLSSLLKKINKNEILKTINIQSDPDIVDLFKDSREVIPGSLFCAMGSDILDGHKFISDALKNGAAAILAERNSDIPRSIPQIFVKDSADAFAKISAHFFGNPAWKLNITGITGTNGKTTSTYVLEAVLTEWGKRTGVIGTVNYRYNDKNLPSENTTPHANHYHRLLKTMTDEGITHIVSEISSHGLTLKRVNALDIDTALFTNLTQDHLDFHSDLEDYYLTKKSLFTDLLKNSTKKYKNAIINIDDNYGKRLYRELLPLSKKYFNLFSISILDKSADFHTDKLKISIEGSEFSVVSSSGICMNIATPLIGHHNVSNILGIIAIAISYKIPDHAIISSLKNLKTIPGRLDRIKTDSGRHIFVDYAHTPDALKNVLTALRKVSKNRIITIFGCGGDRDRTKRPLMGEIVARHSSDVIITSDNPRTENPDSIINDIIPGIRKHISVFNVEPDRKTAIIRGIEMAERGDIILIAGKGHEDYQILGTEKIYFSDSDVVKEYLNEIE